ncbi:hypothetical protein ACI782_24740 [Geodermatophilus sp. SYSU D00703]
MTATSTAPAVRLRLGRDTRRLVLLVHLACSLGWLGADVVLGVLAVTAFTSDDPFLVASSYTALATFAVPVLLTLGSGSLGSGVLLGLGSLGSGVLLGLGSRWGVVRTRWVLGKLLINLALVALVPVLLQPQVAATAALVRSAGPVLADDLGRGPVNLLFPAFASGTALVVASVLAIWKPWGPTRRRR